VFFASRADRCLLATHATTLAARALIALALFAYEASRDLPGMRGFAFGPGTAPRGVRLRPRSARPVAVSATGLLTKGPGIDRFHIRGPLFITPFGCVICLAGPTNSAFVIASCFSASWQPPARRRRARPR